jgi:hypothetical protein
MKRGSDRWTPAMARVTNLLSGDAFEVVNPGIVADDKWHSWPLRPRQEAPARSSVPRIVLGPVLGLSGCPKPDEWDLSVSVVIVGSPSRCKPLNVYQGGKLFCTSKLPVPLIKQGDYQLVRYDITVRLHPDRETEYM